MKVKDLMSDDHSTNQGLNENLIPKGENLALPIQIFQPWSNMIVKVKIPDEIFKVLLEMYDETKKNWKSFGSHLVGQVEEEPEVTEEMRNKFPKWRDFCLTSVREYIKTATNQTIAGEESRIKEFNSDQIFTRLTTMWFVNQRPNEYNPIHIHTNCKVSAVCYLKTPKQQVKDRKKHYQCDGKITFSNNTGTDSNFANHQITFEPVAGDMYIFGALQHHMVWPYRSADPNDERVSLSFNADFRTSTQLKYDTEQQERMYEEMTKFKQQQSEVKDDKSADVSNVNKSG